MPKTPLNRSTVSIEIGRGTIAFKAGVIALATLLSGCSNSPYPEETGVQESVYYSSFEEAPKDLDPQRAYTSWDGTINSHCYESLLGYDYLARPLALTGELATSVPEAKVKKDTDGKITEVRYAFEMHPGIRFANDPCFTGGKGRLATARDVEYAVHRVADPTVNCPVFDSFAHLLGLREHREKITAIRKEMTDAAIAAGTEEKDVRLNSREIYDRAGDIAGVQVQGDLKIDFVMDHPYPQILYWLAMRFVCAVPHEAVDYYNGQHGTIKNGEPMEFDKRPVGTGPYQFDWSRTNRESRLVLVRNQNWWALDESGTNPAFARVRSEPGETKDEGIRAWSPEIAGKPVTPPDRIEFRMEQEALPRFNKFLQGYYDIAAIPKESFSQAIQANDLSPDMVDRNIRLVRDVGLDIRYIGFNMDDDQIGAPTEFSDPKMEAKRQKTLERNKKIRQAMSLAIDTREHLRIFRNGLGKPAQTPIPPGIFGYDPAYKNPYRQYDSTLTKAKQLLIEAGCPNGIDPETGNALSFAFVTGDTSGAGRIFYGWFIDAWKALGINVVLEASDYNKFQERMHKGSYQIFYWGWLADYPDPENFTFLCYGPNSAKYNDHYPGHARYESKRYDFLFKKMETIENHQSATWTEPDGSGGERTVTMTRKEIIAEMIDVFAEDCPWIPISHSEDYILYHGWTSGVKPHPITGGWYKYYRINPEDRGQSRLSWNKPILWPALIIPIGLILFLIPAIRTIQRERR